MFSGPPSLTGTPTALGGVDMGRGLSLFPFVVGVDGGCPCPLCWLGEGIEDDGDELDGTDPLECWDIGGGGGGGACCD